MASMEDCLEGRFGLAVKVVGDLQLSIWDLLEQRRRAVEVLDQVIPFGSSLWLSNPMMRSRGCGEERLMMIWATEVDLDEVVDNTARLKGDHRTQDLLCLFAELEKAIERDPLGRIGPASEPLKIARQLFGDLLSFGNRLLLAQSDVGKDQIG